MPASLTITWSNQITQLCHDAIGFEGPITFDFSSVNFIEPFGLVSISTTLEKCCLQKKKVQYVPPQKEKVKAYLSKIGFDKIFFLDDKPKHASTSLELKRLTALNPVYTDSLMDLMDTSIKISEEDKFQMRLHINELLTNGFDHSHSKTGCYVCAQWYPHKQDIRMCVADGGIGILDSLNRSGKYGKFTRHDDAIKKAVEEGVTTRVHKKGGIGLTFVRKYTIRTGGLLTIISGDAKVNFYRNKIEIKKHSAHFGGTIVSIRIRPGKDVIEPRKEIF